MKNYPESFRAADALYRIGTIYSGLESGELRLAKGKERVKTDYEKAIEKYRQLTREYPDIAASARAYYQMGEIYRTQLEDYRQALAAYSHAVDNYPKRNFYEGKGYKNSLADEAQFKIGRIYYENLRDYEMASEIFSKFLDNFPDSCRKAAAYSYIAAIHEQRKNQEAAADYLEQIIDLIVESDVQSTFFIRDALYDGDKKQDGMLSSSDIQMDIIKQLRRKASQLRTRVARSEKENNQVNQ